MQQKIRLTRECKSPMCMGNAVKHWQAVGWRRLIPKLKQTGLQNLVRTNIERRAFLEKTKDMEMSLSK